MPNLDKILTFISASKEKRIFKSFCKRTKVETPGKPSELFMIEAPPGVATLVTVRLFMKAISKLMNVTFVLYRSGPQSRLSGLKEFVRFIFSIEKILGCKRFFYAGWKPKDIDFYRQFYHEHCNLEDPEFFENFHYRGILIGDLIYDDYMRRKKSPTIDFSDPHFLSIFYESITLFDIYFRFFEENNIKGIAGSNSVYHFAIPLRIACFMHIPTYCLEYNGIARLTQNHLSSASSFTQYKNFDFDAFAIDWEKIRPQVKDRIQRRFSGEVGVDMHFSTISSFQSNSAQAPTPKSTKKTILVALHDFFDAPHVYGKSFYPDFLTWLRRLGEISKRTNYEWYLKPHPQEVSDSSTILKSLVMEFPAFQLVPSKKSHHDFIADGIDLVLTVYGTVGWEYPCLGVPVMNASLNNPHSAFNFSITPSSRDEYERLLLNLSDFPPMSVDLDEIYRFYFLHYFSSLPHIAYYDFNEYVREIGGREYVYSARDLELYSNYSGTNKRSESLIVDALIKFILDKSLRMNLSHFGEIPGTK